MGASVLDDVLACTQLPSLPSVAVKLLELTSDPNVQIKQIAELVMQDQALSSKVLKTVNSSFYGLSAPCGSIDRALKYLGLATVKSIVLGFSLVETTKGLEDGALDLESHWQGSLNGACAAREMARRSRLSDPDEAFTGGLFRDIGVLGMAVALGDRYTAVLKVARDTGEDLCAIERRELGDTHANVGAALAVKWKLPGSIKDAITYHHRGQAGVGETKGLVQAVALGGTLAEVLSSSAPKSRLSEFSSSAREWAGFTDDPAELLERVDEDSRTLAKLFNVEMGEAVNINQILAEASDRSLQIQMETQRQAEQMAAQAFTDGLTGIGNRKRFDQEMEALAPDGRLPDRLGVIFFDADRFKSVNDTHGHAAGDAVLMELARRGVEALGDDGELFRYGGEEFVALLPGLDLEGSRRVGERLRSAMEARVFDLDGVDCEVDSLHVTISVGVSSVDGGDPSRISGIKTLLTEADEAVYVAKRSGRNRVCAHGDAGDEEAPDAAHVQESQDTPLEAPPIGATAAPGGRILLIEDDALAATLIKTVLTRRNEVEVDWVRTGAEIMECLMGLEEGRTPPPQLVVTDLNLPEVSGFDVLDRIRGSESLCMIPVVVITASADGEVEARCRDHGAAAYVHKDELATGLSGWVRRFVSTGKKKPAA